MNAIAAISNNWVMADNDKPLELPWKESADLKFFKEMTYGKKVICAPKTFHSVKHLKNRKIYLYYRMGKKGEFSFPEVEGYIPECSAINEKTLEPFDDNFFVIGGCFAYKNLIPFCKKIYLTKFNFDVNVENPLKFPYEDKDFLSMGFTKNEFRKLDNATIYEYSK